MEQSSLNKETILRLIDLMPAEAVQKAIANLEEQALLSEIDAQSKLEAARKLREDVKELRRALELVKDAQSKNESIVKGPKLFGVDYSKKSRQTYKGGNFKDRIIKIFNDEIPKTSNEIYKIHSDQFGSLGAKSFSSQLSVLVKEGKTIKFKEIDLGSSSKKNFYGLVDWFEDNDEMKQQYQEKLKTKTA